jgi:phosphohistidine phosphatase
MKTLYLLRHAKAEREAASGADFDRPLAARGKMDAAALGQTFAIDDAAPGIIVTSTSCRTLETVDHLTAGWPERPKIDADRQLYLAPGNRLLETLRKLDASVASAMIVAHNPGIEELAIRLAGTADNAALRRMQRKFPTCAMATYEVSVKSWSRLGPEACELLHYVTPKDLADGSAA